MILWIMQQLGLGDYWTLNLMGVSIVLESLLVLDGIWFCLLISDVINDYFMNRRKKHARHSGRGKKGGSR